MAFDGRGDPFQQPNPTIMDLRIKANSMVKEGNAYEIGNQLIVEKLKREVLYKNGVTLPVGAQKLMDEAKRKSRHSAKLSRNMAAGGYAKPADAVKRFQVYFLHGISVTFDPGSGLCLQYRSRLGTKCVCGSQKARFIYRSR